MSRSRSTIWRNLVLIVLSLMFSLGLCELFLRLFVPVSIVGPALTTFDPIYSKRLKKNFSAKRITPEFTMYHTTNSLGFRGPELRSFPHRPILFLGDSFTQGYGVNDGLEFPQIIRQDLAKRYGSGHIPVVNAGMGNNGNGRWIKFLSREGKRYDPRLVVLQIHRNDFIDNRAEKLFELSPAGKLVENPVPPVPMLRIIQELIELVPGLSYSYLIGFLRNVISHQPKSGSIGPNSLRHRWPEEVTVGDTITFCLVREATTICKHNGWPVLVVTVGLGEQHTGELRKILDPHNVPIIRIPSKEERPEFYYRIDSHWNKAGHAFVARVIIGHLTTMDLGI